MALTCGCVVVLLIDGRGLAEEFYIRMFVFITSDCVAVAVLRSVPFWLNEPIPPSLILSESSKVALAGSLLISFVTLRISSCFKLGALLRQNSMYPFLP